MQQRKNRSAFTLVEVLIVVVIMAILAATIIPQFTDSTKDARESTSKFNLHTMRSQIELYKAHHSGEVPDSALAKLKIGTDADGNAGGPFGPYMRTIPENPFTNSNAVKVITNDPAQAGDVTSGGGGWLYNSTTGAIFIDHADYFQE